MNTIHILGERLSLCQHPEGFKTSIDAVLLAAACPAKQGDSILDLGCGVGSAGLSVLTRVPDTTLTGIDIQSDHIDLAIQNATDNGFHTRAQFIEASIKTFSGTSMNHVICNPPYLKSGHYNDSPTPSKDTAITMADDVTLDDWVTCAFNHIKGQGSFTIIHRADQVDQIIQALGKRFGGTEIIPLWPKTSTDAKRVIIRTYKHRKSSARLHAGLTLHDENGDYTSEARAILKDMKAIY
jgi:tRNA1(Val) A37 N6-methylase TrmN6